MVDLNQIINKLNESHELETQDERIKIKRNEMVRKVDCALTLYPQISLNTLVMQIALGASVASIFGVALFGILGGVTLSFFSIIILFYAIKKNNDYRFYLEETYKIK
jgi:hypothetical protein